MLGVVVSTVSSTRLPVDTKLALADTIADPVEAHVNGFGSTLFDGVVDDAFGGGVVGHDGCGRLWPAHFLQSGSEHAAILGIVEQGTDFGFCGRGEDITHEIANNVKSTIERCLFARFWLIAEIVIAAGSGASFWLGKVGGIALDVQDHVAGMVTEDSIGVSGSIVEEPGGSFGSCLSASGLGGCKGAEGDKHGRINGTGIVEQDTDDFLETFDALFGQEWGGVRRVGHLGRGTIHRLGPCMGRVLLPLGAGVFKTLEGTRDISWHGEVASPGIVVPIESDTTIEGTSPIDAYFIVGLKDALEVGSMVLTNILDTKVINCEAEHDGSGGVFEHGRGVFKLVVAVV